MVTDYHFYGRIVSPIWNIFEYNARSGGDELYGVEPLSYYWKNLLLNFNMVALLGVASLPILALKRLANIYPRTVDDDQKNNNTAIKEMLVLIPMYIWMAMVLPRPHKEERFMFPIYPMLCFGAAISVREALCLFNTVVLAASCSKKEQVYNSKNVSFLVGVGLLAPSAMLSLSRSFALNNHYSAPVEIYRTLFSHAAASASVVDNKVIYVCTAGEWYRFPSSFFLPPNHQLGFLKSSFTGQLPQPFTIFGSKEESLEVQVGKFNADNKEEMDRYAEIEQCSYIVEMVPYMASDVPVEAENGPHIPECVQYMASDSDGGSWMLLASHDYLDTLSTPLLHRALYLPIGRSGNVIYNRYNLYERESNN